MKYPAFHAPVHGAVLALGLAAAPLAFAQSTATLRETVVTASRLPDTSRALPMGVAVVTADDIRASGATTVNEALIRLLGIPGRLDLYGGGEYTLDLRGFGVTADSNQVVVLDGQRLTEADTSGTRLSGIAIDTVERIEVLRGSGAVLYGEGASGGVIVITTRAGAGTQRRNTASVYGGAGSNGLRDGRATATLASGGFSLDASVQRRLSDGHRRNGSSATDAQSLGLQWSNDWLRVGASTGRDDLDARLAGGLSAAQYAADPTQASTPNDWARLRSQRDTISASAELGSWQLSADLGKRTRTLRSASGYEFDVDADTQALRARHDGSVAGMKNVLVLGYDRGGWQREVLGAFGSTAEQRNAAWYVRDDLTLASGTRLAAGLRSERIEKTDTNATANLDSRQQAWELGASHPLTADLTAYARLGRSYRLAKVDEFNFTTPGLALQPQTSRDIEAGARWAKGGSALEARLWRSNLANEIGYDPSAAGPFSPFGFNGANINFDPTRRQGLEVDASQRISPTLTVRGNLALRRASFRSGPHSGKDVPLVPRGTLALRADWVPLAGHRLTGGVNWVSSQYVDFANSCSVPRYATADLRYAYQWRQAEFSVGAANLFDRKYFTQAYACAGGQTTSIYPEPGRVFTAAVRVVF
ncbi:MAG: TonB-dependent receptor [Pseudomonadota bacterium]